MAPRHTACEEADQLWVLVSALPGPSSTCPFPGRPSLHHLPRGLSHTRAPLSVSLTPHRALGVLSGQGSVLERTEMGFLEEKRADPVLPAGSLSWGCLGGGGWGPSGRTVVDQKDFLQKFGVWGAPSWTRRGVD